MENQKLSHTIVSRSPWWAPWLFMLLLFSGWATFQHYSTSNVAETNREARSIIREAGMLQCERVNQLRHEMNLRNEVLGEVLETAIASAEAREDFEVAHRFHEHRDDLIEMPMIDCEEVYPPEMEQAGFGGSMWSG